MSRRKSRTRLYFPQIRRIVLDKFSLYTQRQRIELDIADGVVCLAGANGIGKSTFLSALNFGLTGIVPLSSRTFMSAAEYYKDGLRFSDAFFDGRITEDDRESAQITVDFDIRKVGYQITRGLFEPNCLRSLSIIPHGEAPSLIPSATPEDRQRIYATHVATAVGLKTFEQFVFLQHFVLTFDESRHLLFWDARALEQALYLAFGTDSEIAASAERLRREIDGADSRGRNFQFHATGVLNRIQTLEEALSLPTKESKTETDLRGRYDQLLKEREGLENELDKATAKFRDAEIALADASAELVTLRKDYESAFARLTGKRSFVSSHPLIRTTLDEQRCGLCGAGDATHINRVKDAVKRNECPLCESRLQASGAGHAELLSGLKTIDKALANTKSRLETCASAHERLLKEKTRIQERFASSQEAVQAFETKHETVIAQTLGKKNTTASAAVVQSLENLRTEHKALQAKRREAYELRDTKKKDLKLLQNSLELSYAAAEDEFVPIFRKLAKLFLGIDLDIHMEGKGATGIALVLELRNTIRREHHQLSESQRFFVDIALRMAMAQFMSNDESPAGLLIDTPEGSLDIAYESRAGEMFAQFVKGGHSIMMTANINSSQLLKKLANECGPNRMNLTRMTTWTELSEVQVMENKLFQLAYTNIEKELLPSHGKS